MNNTITIDGNLYYTRAWMMDGCRMSAEESTLRHRAFYGQFVTPSIEEIVRRNFAHRWADMTHAQVSGEDVYFNKCTAVSQWDRLSDTILRAVGRLVTLCSYATPPPPGVIYWSLSESICICKQAARMIIERENCTALQNTTGALVNEQH